MQYAEQEWDFAKVRAGAEFGLPGGTRCKVLDWDLHTGLSPAKLLVKYRQQGVDHLMQVQLATGAPKVGPRLVLFVPVEETVVHRRVFYNPALGGDGVMCINSTGQMPECAVGEIELTISHIPGEPPQLTGARAV